MDDMRTGLLMELIDQMHSRLADKMFPPDPDGQDEPAASGIPGSEAAADTPPATVESHGDIKGDEEGIPGQEMSDEELDEMMKGLSND